MRNRHLYPANWKLISLKLIWERAYNICEVCGIPNHSLHPKTGRKQTLSVAHLNHTPSDMRLENLKVMCNYCHLHHDRLHHKETRFLNKNKS